jgi:hypothetical protein
LSRLLFLLHLLLTFGLLLLPQRAQQLAVLVPMQRAQVLQKSDQWGLGGRGTTVLRATEGGGAKKIYISG